METMAGDASTIDPWPERRTEPLYDCGIIRIERSFAASPMTGAEHEFVRVDSCDWVQIIPLTAERQVVMVRQYRHGARRLTLEIPGGLLDPGEDPATAAARECLEETGYAARTVEPMGAMNPNPALFSNQLHSFCAYGVERVGVPQTTPTEQTEVVLVPLDEVAAMLRENRIDHSLVAATLWRFLCEHGDRRS
jgi:ADP-ribose diphosphatase